MRLRQLRTSDSDKCLQLFHDTVHSINARDYNQQQLDAWAPGSLDAQKFGQSLLANQAYVVEHEGNILGFADMSSKGYIDRFYVHRDWQGHGIATKLFNQLQHAAIVIFPTVQNFLRRYSRNLKDNHSHQKY